MSIPATNNIAAIYDLERVGEVALSNYFKLAGINAFTSQAIPGTGDAEADAALVAQGYTLLDFQRDRPRVEIFSTIGGGKGRFIPHPQFSGVECETQWDIQFQLFLVTEPDMRTHAAFRTLVRYLVHSARGTINALDPLTRHYLSTFVDGGTSPVEKPEEGTFQTRIILGSTISVQSDAWQLLTT